METADQSLSKREECVSTLQEQIRELEGTGKDELVPETPVKPSSTPVDKISSALDKFRASVSALDFSFTKEGSSGKSSRKMDSYHGDSSGVVADCESEDLSDNEVFFKKVSTESSHNEMKVKTESKSTNLKGSINDNLSVEYSGSDLSDIVESPKIRTQTDSVTKHFHFTEKSQTGNSNYFQFHKPLNDSRVLQVVLTPLKNKMVVKHTKSSMLRLKNSPVKDPTRGRECQKIVRRSLKMGKENVGHVKRKCHDDSIEEEIELNTSKRRKVVENKRNKKTAKTKHTTVNRTGQKYNLRTRK